MTLISSCAQLGMIADNSADAIVSYCESNSKVGRELLRATLTPAAREEDIAICLRCPGEEVTYCVGDSKTIQLGDDDSG